MNLKLGALADTKQLKLDTTSSPDEPKNTDSASAQMEAFVEQYQRKIRAAKNKARGLRANTLGAPTLEAPTLTRNTLGKKTFAEGGEVKKFEDDEVSQEELDAASRPAFVSPNMRRATKISRANDPTDRIMGAIEPALTLGTGAVAAAVGMPRGIYKGLTSGQVREGKAASIASKEAADFIERNTYVPRSETGQENLAALSKIVDRAKLAPVPGGAAMASLARPALGSMVDQEPSYMRKPGILESARRSTAFKDKGLLVPQENVSSKDMLEKLASQGIDTERTWLRGKKATDTGGKGEHVKYDTLEYLYNYQRRPDAVEEAMRDSKRSQALAGSTLSRQLEDRPTTKFNTKGGVWLTESPSAAETYSGEKGYVIPVHAPKPDVVVDAMGEQWDDFYKTNKDWKKAFADPKIRLIEVKNVIDAGPNWTSMISPDASEEELRAMLTSTNLFAKKPFDKRVVNKLTGEPYKYKRGGEVKSRK
jgi:hypothetical protein